MQTGTELDELLRKSAVEMAAAVAAGDATAVELVDAAIARIETVNPRLNAVVGERFDHARLEAADADAAQASGAELGPLHGVPFTVAESIALAACPHSAGTVARSAHIAQTDATAVSRLRSAGAIALGVTNTSELGFWVETTNRVYGRTQNPHDIRRTPGGGCGGQAAIVSAAAVPFGIGGGSLGSVRFSAACCGVFGMRPSSGVVPLTGLHPLPVGRARRYASVGPIASHASDLEPILRIIAGPDAVDFSATPLSMKSPSHVDFTWKRIVICDELGARGTDVTREFSRAVRRAGRLLADAGGEVEDWHPEPFKRAHELWLALTHESYGLDGSFGRVVGHGESPSVVAELARLGVGRSKHTFPTLAMTFVEKATRGAFARMQRFAGEGRRLRQRINTMLHDGGVLILPTMPRPAVRHGRSRRHPLDFLYAALFNVLELPSVAVPMGVGRDGLPISVQVVAAHGRDDVCIAAANLLARPGETPRPGDRSRARARRKRPTSVS